MGNRNPKHKIPVNAFVGDYGSYSVMVHTSGESLQEGL